MVHDRRQATAAQPLDQAHRCGAAAARPALRDDAHRRDHVDPVASPAWPAPVPARRCSKYSWLPVAPVIGEGVMPCGANPIAAAAASHSFHHALVHGGIQHEPAAANLVASRLELRLDQRHHVRTGAEQRRNRREDQAQRDERHVDGDDIHRTRQMRGQQVARVHPFDDEDARVVAQPPVELPMSHVERDDVVGATLQEHISEPARRCPDVEPVAPAYLDRGTCRAHARASARRGRRTG